MIVREQFASLLPLPSLSVLYLSDAAMTALSLGQVKRASLSLPPPHPRFHSDLPSSKSLSPGYKERSGFRIQIGLGFYLGCTTNLLGHLLGKLLNLSELVFSNEG